MRKKLVAYFSAGGVTAHAAKALTAAIDADLYEIVPETPYTRADLNWNNAQSRSTVEMKNPASRPAIKGHPPEMSGYDTVFVGFPIWWYTAPTIVKTFLEACHFSGQTIALFATSGGSGMGNTASDLAPCCPGAVMRGERMLNGAASAEELKKWAAL